VAMLVALGRAPEIRVHVKGQSTRVTKDELREVLMHAAVYCGIPAAVDGFRNASAVLAEMGLSDGAGPGQEPGRVRRRRQHGPRMAANLASAGFPLVIRDSDAETQRRFIASTAASRATRRRPSPGQPSW